MTRRPALQRDDSGMTLPEVLIAVLVVGLVMGVISAAIIVILGQSSATSARLLQSKDEQYISTYLPNDLNSAATADDAPNAALTCSGVAAPGTNVLLLHWSEGTDNFDVSYRYVKSGNEYQLVRVSCSATKGRSQVVVAHQLAAPPANLLPWVDGAQKPSFAVNVSSRATGGSTGAGELSPNRIGRDLTVTLQGWTVASAGATATSVAGADSISVGGSGLSGGDDIAPGSGNAIALGSAPRSRCGGRIAMVIDTSGSIPQVKGDAPLRAAAKGFIDGFAGTPTSVMLLGFDYRGYAMYPEPAKVNGLPALTGYTTTAPPYVSLLDTTKTTPIKSRIDLLDDYTNRTWASGSNDPNGDGYHWDQPAVSGQNQNTNWEDGLWQAIKDGSGNLWSDQPDMLVFITDGDPNRNRTDTDAKSNVSKAKDVADAARSAGVRVIGIGVGDVTKNLSKLTSVVGTVAWDGKSPGNAGTANYFTGDASQSKGFGNIGTILSTIAAAQCGGTVTAIPKTKAADGSYVVSTVPWTFATDTGTRTTDPVSGSGAATFDYTFPSGNRTVKLGITSQSGYALEGVTCTRQGQPFPSTLLADGVQLTLGVNDAVSCSFTERTA